MEVDEARYSVSTDNVNAITQSGGLPLILSFMTATEDVERIANMIDGFYFTGGYDIDPTIFGEEPHPNLGTIIPARDTFEIALIQKLLEHDKPILAVCRGCQILNIAAGGDMFQDIYAQLDENLLQHQQKAPKAHGSHFVDVLDGSLLHQLTGKEKLRVNSRHHQANRKVLGSLEISAKASDGIIEAIESKEKQFVLGLQWHPENMLASGDEASRLIYQGFIEACKK